MPDVETASSPKGAASWREYARQPAWKRLALLGLSLLGLVVVAAFIADIKHIEVRRAGSAPTDAAADIQAILQGLNGPRYADPGGRFSLVPPAGWTIVGRPDSRPFDVRFRGPQGVDLGIMAEKVDYDDFGTLVRNLEKVERKLGLDTRIQPIKFTGRPAARRTSRLRHVKVLALDFVENRVEHHISCEIPHALFDRYEPVLMELLNTYQPAAP